MKTVSVVLCFLLWHFPATATEFQLTRLERYGKSPGIELGMRAKNANTLNQIFNVIKLPSDKFYIRLIGVSSDKTNVELLYYYKKKLPNELDAALKSSGNIHNPTIVPLRPIFPEALKSTSLYSELMNELSKRGYKIDKIHFEKFRIRPNKSMPVPDVHLYVSKAN